MKLIVNPHKIEIIKDEAVNEREIDISKCVFEFHEDITDDYVKEAYFTLNNQTYKQIIINNECSFPSEVLEKQGTVEIGVVAYLVENEEEIKRYNPSPAYFNTWQGSLKEAQNSEPITPSEMEQFEQQLQEGLNSISETIENVEKLDVDVAKTDGTTTIEITKQDGSKKTAYVNDGANGIGLNYNWDGTSLGVKREDEINYNYTNLKGDKGDAGAIKFEIVMALPTEDIKEDTIYLVPITPDTQDNNYEEYIYVNGQWELLGKIGVQIDLSNYQEKIDSSHKLSSDLVDDTNNTNKFVTNIEKNTWNGKANASDVYNKTESDNRYLQNSKIVILTQAEYDALETKDATVYYLIKEV